MLYNLSLSNLVVSMTSLNPVPKVVGFSDNGYGTLVNNVIKAVIPAIQAAITVNLGDVVQQLVGPKVNSFIQRM